MASFAAGDLAYVDYGEVPVVVHERLVLGQVEGLDYVIATPDRDVYTETLDGSNPDILGRGGLVEGFLGALHLAASMASGQSVLETIGTSWSKGGRGSGCRAAETRPQ